MLEYRLENNIIPRDGSWQDAAITSKEGSMSQLKSTTLLTEEEFNTEENRYLKDQYGTYSKYKAAIQKQIDQWNTNIHIADQSMATGKPDMTLVPKGARSQTANFLYYSMFVALVGVVIGGWLVASEFQFGTIRLLIIRPKTRFKILMSKFAAGLAICLGIYIAGSLINAILNGILFGFSDFGNPNYSIGGQTAFIGYYLPKFFACMITILFGYSLAFMFSTVVKNIAVSISVPIVFFIGCYIGLSLFNGYSYMPSGMPDWLAYTPLPYIQISSFFMQNSSVKMLINNGVPISLGYGLGLLSGISVLCTMISVWVFKKKDITN
jgi:ABC-2 type transport system permease protein